jgi:hypothetical protein
MVQKFPRRALVKILESHNPLHINEIDKVQGIINEIDEVVLY